MELVPHVCLLAITASGLLWNAYVGFLGTVVGEYRMRKKSGTAIGFRLLYREKEREFWRAHTKSDGATTAALLIFAHAGFVLFLFNLFGPVGEEKWVEPKVKIKHP